MYKSGERNEESLKTFKLNLLNGDENSIKFNAKYLESDELKPHLKV
jgi:hypothetical protein